MTAAHKPDSAQDTAPWGGLGRGAGLSRRASDRRGPSAHVITYGALTAILIVGAFLRFWGVPNGQFHFMGDEGNQTAAEWRLLHGHLPLLGPSLSIGSMHLGPLFYYLEAVPLWLAGGSPVGPTILVGIGGLATVGLLFLYLRPSVGEAPALAGCAAMSVSFLMVEYSRRPWNPTLTPIFMMGFLYALVAWKRRSGNWLPLVAICLAALLQLQPVNVLAVGLLAVFVIIARPPLPSGPIAGLSVVLFGGISLPLILYDATHHLANTHAWLEAFVGGKSTAPHRTTSSVTILFNLFNRAFEPRILFLSIVLCVVLVLGGLMVSLSSRSDRSLVGRDWGFRRSPLLASQRDFEPNWEIVLAMLLLFLALVAFTVYTKVIYEQYMVCLFVVPFILLAAFVRVLLSHKLGLWLAIILMAGIVGIGVRDSWFYTFSSPYATVADASVTGHDVMPDDTYHHVRDVADQITRWAKGRPFQVRMASYLNVSAPYRYALARMGYPSEPSSHVTFLLIEPPEWPVAQWRSVINRRDVRHVDRTTVIGAVRIDEVLTP